ncbi:hypothetical protein K438DRAFT_1966517 [Mycena galopus ATCC 62051]|nr:hypothetical protein K438DRAFT_1966517 [Mycena galopus ATCC 62051]
MFQVIIPDANNNLDIPEEVHEHSAIRALSDSANDMVAWANNLYSYKVESSPNDIHNMLVVVMDQRNLDLPRAFDVVGKMYEEAINRFKTLQTQVPSWERIMDEDMAQNIRNGGPYGYGLGVYFVRDREVLWQDQQVGEN